MIWIDIKYANMLSLRFDKFKLKKNDPYVAQCRCPFCGDSEFSKNKTRGYILAKGSRILFYCHNCGTSTTLGKLLLKVDPRLHDEYRLEVLREGGGFAPKQEAEKGDIAKFSKKRFEKYDAIKKLKKVSSLPVGHPARKYIESRKIPPEQHYRLYYCEKFVAWVNSIESGKLSMKEHPRIVIPFLDETGRMFGFQGRSLAKNSAARYITIMMDDSMPKVFGLDKSNTKKQTFILEGPIDSLFVTNSIAMAGSDANVSTLISKENAVFVYDNEPRSKQIVKKMLDRVDQGYRVVVFPEKIEQKDINDMILAGYEQEELSVIMNNNIYSGLAARLRISDWSKV